MKAVTFGAGGIVLIIMTAIYAPYWLFLVSMSVAVSLTLIACLEL